MNQGKKFTEVKNIADYEVLTDTGWEDIKKSGKTIPYVIWRVETESGRFLECADTHILFTENLEEVFVSDIKIGDLVMTEDGAERVKKIDIKNKKIEMYDLELEEGNHRYFTNGFLSHNTLYLCHMATALTRAGYNVLYVSGEMDENLIAQRIDANILDMSMDEFNLELEKKAYLKKIRDVYTKVSGKLKIKEYSAGACNALHLKNLLQEYKLKDGFEADVVILDYINLFSSFRLPASAMSNSYLYVKTVAEEMRGLAREFNYSCISATQTNRGGADAGDSTDMSDTADSYGLPMTVDGLYAIIQNEELFNAGKYLNKVLKSRFGDNINTIYTCGVDRKHMRLLDLPEDQQELPQHIKDQLNWQAQKDREKKDKEATEDIGMTFD